MKEAPGFSPVEDKPRLDKSSYKRPDLRLMERVLGNPHTPGLSFGLFLAGKAELGDVSRLTFEERKVILSSTPGQTIRPDILMKPSRSLEEFIKDPKYIEQAKGHIFLSEAAQLLANSLPGAAAINSAMIEDHEVDINGLLDKFESGSLTGPDLNQIVVNAVRKPKNLRNIAYYLAHRSAAYERRQEELYGEDLNRAKTSVKRAISELAGVCKLPSDKTELAHRQVDAARFLSAGLLEQDTSRPGFGGYSTNLFRVQVMPQYRGLDLIKQTGLSAYQIITHELSHCSSAQSAVASGLGILRGEKIPEGIEVNEAMTEYIARIARRVPVDSRNPDGSLNKYNFYISNVNALHQARRINPVLFAELFNANYANPGENLARALDLFYFKFEKQIGFKNNPG